MADWQPLIDFSVAFPKNFNREFRKYINGQNYSEYLPLGLWQFYPSWVEVRNGEMFVTGECGSVLKMKREDAHKTYHKYFSEIINKGACV